MRDAAETLKRLTFELGGKSPNIVFADADLDAAVDGRALRPLLQPGPVLLCRQPAVRRREGPRRVRRQARRRRTRTARSAIRSIPTTEQGPQVDKAQFDKIMHYIEHGKKEGAKLRHRRQAARRQGLLHRADALRRRDGRHDDRQGRDLWPGAQRAEVQGRRRSRRARQQHQLRPGRRRLDPRHRQGPPLAAQMRAGTVWVNCYDVFDAAAPFGGFKNAASAANSAKPASRPTPS